MPLRKKKRHPIGVPYTEGDLFAVQIAPDVFLHAMSTTIAIARSLVMARARR